MDTYINRPIYLQKLIDRRDNGEIKIVTGSRRCGKSWLLKKIYRDYLLSEGVNEENVIYNELLIRGYLVDVGVLEARRMVDGKSSYVQYEVDFIATNGMEKYYIQSAYVLATEEKREQELNSFKRIDDSFQKIVIVGDDIATYTDEQGIVFMGLFQFLGGKAILQ